MSQVQFVLTIHWWSDREPVYELRQGDKRWDITKADAEWLNEGYHFDVQRRWHDLFSDALPTRRTYVIGEDVVFQSRCRELVNR